MSMNKVTILRRWSSPLITINVSIDAISIEMSLDDFVMALTDEVAEPLVRNVVQAAGSPALILTKAQLENKLVQAIESQASRELFKAATETIVAAVKRETLKIV